MELKGYQQDALDVLQEFLGLCTAKTPAAAFAKFSNKKYQSPLGAIPQVCLKVPTGGGKTFMAAASLKLIFDSLPLDKPKLVVWLVPSETILTQTYKNLSDVNHPYRQRLNNDFGNDVAIYNKEQLLRGEDFSPATVADRLSVLVLSVDSFRRQNRESYKVYQENGQLLKFEEVLTPADYLNRNDTEKVSLINVLRHYKPVIIIDESHHTKTDLSFETLTDFNADVVLELTATPHRDSNILTQVSSSELKDADMVKIPVIVFNHKSQQAVINAAINLRGRLEQIAMAEGVRPIVLFQAESAGKENRATFDKIKTTLIDDYNIPAEEIAIKTATINELKNVDLMAADCPIRYIITINALKEGWDCPFAYILASLANRSSAIDVEQILGRILRRPFIKKFDDDQLNRSYAFTSSEHFRDVLDNISYALRVSGFSGKDYRAEDLDTDTTETAEPPKTDDNGDGGNTPVEFYIKKNFADVTKIKFPQFCRTDTAGLFNDNVLVDRNYLCAGFDLDKQNAEINFALLDYEAVSYDVNGDENTLAYSNLSTGEIGELIGFRNLTAAGLRRQTIGAITLILDRHYNDITRTSIDAYVSRVMKNFSDDDIKTAAVHRGAYARKIIEKIDELMTIYAQDKFTQLIDNNTIKAVEKYQLPEFIVTQKSTNSPAKTLYSEEFDDMNKLEYKVIGEIASWSNVSWWHRNIERRGFCINGFINHYPDFIVMLDNGELMLVEVKGAHLNNDDSKRKLSLGKTWAKMSGTKFSYYMVFDDNAPEGAYNFDNFAAHFKNNI